MNRKKVSIFLILTGAFLFNSIFWKERLALNALLFDAFAIGSLFYLYRDAWKNTIVQMVLLGHIASVVSLLWFNSELSKWCFDITLLLLFAFAEYGHRSAWYAGGSMMVAFTTFAGRFFGLLKKDKEAKPSKGLLPRLIRFSIFPLVILFCFFILYSNANTVFAGFAKTIGDKVGLFIDNIFNIFSLDRFFFFLVGFYLTGALLVRAKYTSFEKHEATAVNDMPRIRKKRMDVNHNLLYDLTVGVMGKLAKGIMALKNEYKTGLISLVLLNLLLFVINIIDIDYLWIHFTYTPSVDLYTMIHEGTELLILSIVLAMLVLLMFFRGNLNFYKNNKWLKAGAYAWLFQNMILVVSVLLRDYYYIREFGLAYKRIGVLFFLLLVIAGLVTVFIKIRFAKTNYYLLRVNAWCAVVLLVAGSMIQWDVYIAEYNIAHRKTAPLNLPYLLTLSDKVLPVLSDNLAVLKEREEELKKAGISLSRDISSIDTILNNRRAQYMEQQQKYSWLSWNYTDANEKQYFLAKPPVIASKQ